MLFYRQTLREPWWVLPAEVLHGLTFAAMWAATTDYAHQIAPGTKIAKLEDRIYFVDGWVLLDGCWGNCLYCD